MIIAVSKIKKIMKIPTIRFVFGRKGLSPKDGKGVVEMVITYERQRKFISTGVSCYPGHWKGDGKRNIYVSGTGADIELNGILLTMYQKAYRIVSGQIESGSVDISAIPTLLKRQNVDMTFLQYIIKRMDQKNVVEYTHKSYVSFYNKLSEFGKIKFFSDINEKSIRDFDEWLHAYKWTEKDKYDQEIERHYSQATIGSYHKNLKNFIADAVIDGYLSDNVYVKKGIKVDKGKTRIEEHLTYEDVVAIAKKEMPTRSLAEAKDLFLIQCYSGLAYIDLMTFDFTKAKGVEIGNVITGYRHKTGAKFSWVYTEEAKAILEKYDYHLPKVPNQKYNVKLKLIADAAGIDMNLTTHVGRRSAGDIWLNKGIPLEIVSKCLGHKSIITTQKAYAYIFDKTISETFAKIK